MSNFFNKYKKLIFSILLPLLAGFLGFLISGGTEIYSSINKPSFAPPSFLFPIVWNILYILMGISSYFIFNSPVSEDSKSMAIRIYFTQLLVNILWPLFFFNLKNYLFAFAWLIVLIALIVYMIYLFLKIDKKAGLLNIPYLLWCAFAAVLNFSIYSLNK